MTKFQSKTAPSMKVSGRKVKIKKHKSFEHKIKSMISKGKIKPKIVYEKSRCSYIDSEGKACRRLAVGKSQLCALHGGDERIRDNYLTKTTEVLMNSIVPSSHLVPYDEKVHPKRMIELSREGLSSVEIAAEFKISLHRLKKWAEDYEVFSEAYDVGQALYESWWIRKGISGLDDPRNFNTVLYKFLTGNKLGYSEKIENKHFNISAGVLVVPGTAKSLDEWEGKEVNSSNEVDEVIDVTAEEVNDR